MKRQLRRSHNDRMLARTRRWLGRNNAWCNQSYYAHFEYTRRLGPGILDEAMENFVTCEVHDYADYLAWIGYRSRQCRDNAKECSCWMCRNPRRGKSITWKEKRFAANAKQQIEESIFESRNLQQDNLPLLHEG